MGSGKKFAVVEFLEEKAVEVVPFTWVDEINRKWAYPQGPKAAALRRDPTSIPFHKWPIYSIRLLYITDKFSKADKKADNLQYTSKLDTSGDSSDEECVGRKKKPRVLYSPERQPRNQRRKIPARKEVPGLELSALKPLYSKESRSGNVNNAASNKSTTSAKVVTANFSGDSSQNSRSDIETEQSEVPLPVRTSCNLQNDPNLNIVTCNPLELELRDDGQFEVHLTERCHTENSSNLDIRSSLMQSSPTPSSTTSSQSDAVFLSQCSRPGSRLLETQSSSAPNLKCSGDCFRREFELFQRRMFSELHDIKEDLGAIKANTFRPSGQATECPFSIPIATEDYLQTVEDKLCDRTQRKIFEKWAAQVGGCDYKNHCRRVLKAVFTQELSLRINFTGRNSKLAFVTLKLQDAIVSSVVQSNDIHRSEVEKVIKEWFRNSGDHNGGRDRRRVRHH